jgi:hypothetical protein
MNELWADVGLIADLAEPAFAVGAPPRRDGALGQAPRLIGRRIAARARLPQGGLIVGTPS